MADAVRAFLGSAACPAAPGAPACMGPPGSDFLCREGAVPKPPKLSPDERPHGWQYPAGVLIILLLAALTWFFLHRR